MKRLRDGAFVVRLGRTVVANLTAPFVQWYEENLTHPGRRLIMRITGITLLVLGNALLANDWVYHISKILEPIPNPIKAYAEGEGCNRVQGGGYLLHLEDYDFTCTGADYTCAWGRNVPVVYDKNNPGHCRRADRVGRLSFRDWVCSATRGPIVIALGLFLSLCQLNDSWRLRRLIARSALATCLVLFLILNIWTIANGGGFCRFPDIESIPLTPRASYFNDQSN